MLNAKSCVRSIRKLILSSFVMQVGCFGAFAAIEDSLTNDDIGKPAMSGEATFSDGVLTVSGAGLGISGSHDTLHFVWEEVSGDSTITALLKYGELSRAGLLFRTDTGDSARSVCLGVEGSAGLSLSVRNAKGGVANTKFWQLDPAKETWLRLSRKADVFTASFSSDGEDWTALDAITAYFPVDLLVGTGVSSDIQSKGSGTVTFEDLSISGTPAVKPLKSPEETLPKAEIEPMVAQSSTTATVDEGKATVEPPIVDEEKTNLPAVFPPASSKHVPTDVTKIRYTDFAEVFPGNGRLMFVDGEKGNDLATGLSGSKSSGGNAPKRSLGSAIQAANDQDIIILMPGDHKVSEISPGMKNLMIVPMNGASMSQMW